MTKSKERLASLALLVAVAVICVPLMELAIRVVAPQPQSWFDLYYKPPGAKLFAIMPNLDKLIDTGDTRWHVYTDENGFRRGKAEVAPSDAPTILVLGDSFGFAYGVNYEDSFAGMIDVATGTTARVLNASVPGYGPLQYRKRLDDLLERGIVPDAVLIPVYAGNDFNDCVWNKDVKVEDGLLGGRPPGLKGWFKLNTHLYRIFSKAYHTFGEAPQQDLLLDLYRPAAWDKEFLHKAETVMGEELKAMKQTLDARGIPVFSAFIPTVESVVDAAGQKNPPVLEGLSLQVPREKYLKLVDAAGLDHVDLTPYLAESGAAANYFTWNRHFSPAGNRVAAVQIMAHWKTLAPVLKGQRAH